MKKKHLFLCCLLALTGCANTVSEIANNGSNYSNIDISSLDKLIEGFSQNIQYKWGKDSVKMSSRKVYIKYTDDYLNRSEVNFEDGLIRIETIASTDPKSHLRQAIITTLLTPRNPAHVDLFSSKEVIADGKPFLLGQVKDNEGKDIQWSWRANRFADYLLEHQLKKRQIGFKNSYYVDIRMTANHEEVRGYQYADIVRKASKKYGIDEALIYAIIRTESSFNPYAVSWANAYGLMQVVPKTAGADVYKLVKNRSGMPTPDYLFDPENNIDIGTAYFYILKNHYLKGINNPLSMEYSMISAYNGGAGGLLRTFHQDKETAVDIINRQTPNQIYYTLTKQHQNAEARRYLEKVVNFKKDFPHL